MTRPTPIDREALAQHVEGNRRLAYRLVFDTNRADDISQDAMVAALEARSGPKGALGSWLSGVTRNLAKSDRRRQARRRAREFEAASHRHDRAGDLSKSSLERQAIVTEAVLALPTRYRRMIYLRYFEDMPPRDIASLNGMNVQTVRTQLKRGLKQLRSKLDQDHHGDRKQWKALLAPLVVQQARPQSANASSGTLIRSVMVATTVIGVGLFLWLQASSHSAQPRAAPASADAEPPSTEPSLLVSDPKTPNANWNSTKIAKQALHPALERAFDAARTRNHKVKKSTPLKPLHVAGVVLDPTDSPVEGARVSLWSRRNGVFDTKVNTDPEGRFEFTIDHEQGDALALVATHEKHMALIYDLDLKPNEPTLSDLRVRFEFPLRVQCDVVDQDNRPVGRARCQVVIPQDDLTPLKHELSSVTDDTGRTEMLVPVVMSDSMCCPLARLTLVHVVRIRVEADGYSTGYSAKLLLRNVNDRITTQKIRVVLGPARTIACRIIGPNGEGIPDQEFELICFRNGDSRPMRFVGAPSAYRTSNDGDCTIRGLSPLATWKVRVKIPGYESTMVSIDPDIKDVEFSIAKLMDLNVAFQDGEGGPPLRPTTLIVRSLSPKGSMSIYDAQLVTSLLLKEGTYSIDAHLEGRAKPFNAVATVSPAMKSNVAFVVPQSMHQQVTGSVRGDGGAPLANTKLELRSAKNDRLHASARSDASGAFALTHVEAGAYTLHAQAPGWAPTHIELHVSDEAASRNVQVTLNKGATLIVRLPNNAQGLRAVAWSSSGRLLPRPSRQGATCTFHRCPLGDVTVGMASGMYHIMPNAERSISRRITLRAGGTEHVSFENVGVYSLAGRVLTPEGAPSDIETIVVCRLALGEDSALRLHESAARAPDGEGRIRVAGLIPGRYRILGMVDAQGSMIEFEVVDRNVELEFRGTPAKLSGDDMRR